MEDQAFRLRQLVNQRLQARWPSVVRIGVFGARPGSGVTSVASALVDFWTDHGRATRLLKAPTANGGDNRGTVVDPSDVAGPPSASGPTADLAGSFTDSELPCFPAELALIHSYDAGDPGQRGSGARGHWIVADLGVLGERELQHPTADWTALVLVTTADPLAVMDAYKLVKGLRKGCLAEKVVLAINRCESIPAGAEMGRRFRTACERFMGLAPWVSVIPFLKEGPISGEGNSRQLRKEKFPRSPGRSVGPSEREEALEAWQRSVAELAKYVEHIATHQASHGAPGPWEGLGSGGGNSGKSHQDTEFAGWASRSGQGNEIKAVQNG